MQGISTNPEIGDLVPWLVHVGVDLISIMAQHSLQVQFMSLSEVHYFITHLWHIGCLSRNSPSKPLWRTKLLLKLCNLWQVFPIYLLLLQEKEVLMFQKFQPKNFFSISQHAQNTMVTNHCATDHSQPEIYYSKSWTSFILKGSKQKMPNLKGSYFPDTVPKYFNQVTCCP